MKYKAPEHEIIEYGFNPDKVEIKPDNYLAGSLPFEIIKEDGNYTDYLPMYEPQAENYETWGCTDWGGQNQIEITHKFLFGVEPNYNEIFNYILAGIGPNGANPHDTYETFRKSGLINQDLIPTPDTYEKFRNTDVKPFLEEGKKWLGKYDFKHTWITDTSKENLAYFLKGGPLGIGVTAWYEENGLYIDRGQRNTHWCIAFNSIKHELGIVLPVFDTYDHSVKLLHPKHNISVAKRIILKKKPSQEKQVIDAYNKRGFWGKWKLFNWIRC